jgi:CRISPR-associated Csx3 family protein
MTTKIVVAGPPRSGKSVFLGGLCENLPRNSRYLFRACPDGEGTWTYKGNGSQEYRRKGTFSQEIVDWYCQSLSKCDLAPIILVDIGGVPSEENHRILVQGKVDAAIILAGDLQTVPEWKEFLEGCGVEILTVIHSDYNGQMDIVDGPVLSVHHLERGEDVSSRPGIKAVAEKIMGLVESQKKGGESMNFLQENVVKISRLAEMLGKKAESRTLPNGRVVEQIVWEGSDLKKVAEVLHNQSANLPEMVDIDGAAPAWLVSALAHECHPNHVRLNSPDGYVAVGCRRPESDGSGATWTVEEMGTAGNGRRLVRVEFQLDPSKPLSPAALDDITPPEVGLRDVVVLSGRGPNWLVASVAMSYHGRAAAVAPFQPGTGATVSWTHVSDVGLGEVISVQ